MSDSERRLTDKQVQAAYPAATPKLEMVVIEGRTWLKGPDKLWYMLDPDDDPVRPED